MVPGCWGGVGGWGVGVGHCSLVRDNSAKGSCVKAIFVCFFRGVRLLVISKCFERLLDCSLLLFAETSVGLHNYKSLFVIYDWYDW